MAIMFTEPVRCDSFDLSVTVELGLAVCGETSKCSLEPSKEPKDALHGVRCCSDIDKSTDGWVKNEGCDVWSKSDQLDDSGNQCHYAETYDDARSICRNNEARLCTRKELGKNCARETKCSRKNHLVWTEVKVELDRHDPAIQIVCDDRKVGFMIDPAQIDVENWIGYTLTVEMGKIGANSLSNMFDMNGNPVARNVKFEKKLAGIDLHQASTEFTVTLSNVEYCSDLTSTACINEVKNKIASLLVLSSSDQSRVQVLSVENVTEGTVSARIRMLPSEQESREASRKLLRGYGASQDDEQLSKTTPDHSVGLFKKLQQIVVEGNEEKTRLLSTIDTDTSGKISTAVVSVSDLKILPSESDVKNLLTTDPDMVEEEQELYRYASMRSDHLGTSQAVLSKVERQAMINEIKKEEKNMVGEMKEESKSREEAMMKEIEKERNLVYEIIEESKSREEASAAHDEASAAREEAMMNKIERMSNTEDALFRELKEIRDEKSQSNIKAMHFQLASLTLVCFGISIGAFFALRRN